MQLHQIAISGRMSQKDGFYTMASGLELLLHLRSGCLTHATSGNADVCKVPSMGSRSSHA